MPEDTIATMLRGRYSDARKIAAAISGFAVFVKVLGFITGAAVFLIVLSMIPDYLVVGIILGLGYWILLHALGVLIAAQAQMMTAVLDIAINTSASISAESKSEIIFGELTRESATPNENEFVCSDCGKPVSSSDRVCPHCGARLTD